MWHTWNLILISKNIPNFTVANGAKIKMYDIVDDIFDNFLLRSLAQRLPCVLWCQRLACTHTSSWVVIRLKGVTTLRMKALSSFSTIFYPYQWMPQGQKPVHWVRSLLPRGLSISHHPTWKKSVAIATLQNPMEEENPQPKTTTLYFHIMPGLSWCLYKGDDWFITYLLLRIKEFDINFLLLWYWTSTYFWLW